MMKISKTLIAVAVSLALSPVVLAQQSGSQSGGMQNPGTGAGDSAAQPGVQSPSGSGTTSPGSGDTMQRAPGSSDTMQGAPGAGDQRAPGAHSPSATSPGMSTRTPGANDPNQRTPGTAQTPAQPGSGMAGTANAETIRQVQKQLNDRGMQAGPVDGVMGPMTRSAVQEFQRAQGLDGGGNLTPQTLSALGVQPQGSSGPQRDRTSSAPDTTRPGG